MLAITRIFKGLCVILRLTISCLSLVVGAAAVSSTGSAEVSVDELVIVAVAAGCAAVIVELRLADGSSREGHLAPERVSAQREAIADAQAAVLSALRGDDFRVIRRPKFVPFLALRIGPDALAKLRQMPMLVVHVSADGELAPQSQ